MDKLKNIEMDNMRKIKIKYTGPKESSVAHVTGVAGIVTPLRLIQCDLFTEKVDILGDIELQIDENGNAIESAREIDQLTREICGSYFMLPSTARKIGEWLIEKAEEANMKLQAESKK